MTKHTHGEVLHHGKSGVRVRFDSGEEHWLHRNQIQLAEIGEQIEATLAKYKGQNMKPNLKLVGAGDAALVSDAPGRHDLWESWRKAGQAILDSQRVAVALAEDEVEAARRDVAAAEAMLAEARAALSRAETNVVTQRAELGVIVARLGAL